MTSDAPRRRRNRRRRADERARAMRTLSGISSVARRDRSRDRSRVDSRRRTTRPVAKDPPDDGGLSHQPRFTADGRRVVILLPPLPTARNENEDEKKRILPFPRTKPTPPSFARTPSPVYLRNPKARSPKLERATTIVARTRRALSKREDPTRRATRSVADRRTMCRRRDYLDRWRIFLRLRFKRRVRFFFHLALMIPRAPESAAGRGRGSGASRAVSFGHSDIRTFGDVCVCGSKFDRS
jgi:hypothetical protein